MRQIIDHRGYRIVCREAGFDAEGLIEARLASVSSVEAPFILHMLGIPGSGKSTYVRGLSLPNTVFLSFDTVMEEIPAYQAQKSRDGLAAAFAAWETCAREIGYEILFRAAERKLNIVFDHGGARADHVEMLAHLKAAGYRIEVVHFDVDEAKAAARALERDRHLPPGYISARHQTLAELLPAYQALADAFLRG